MSLKVQNMPPSRAKRGREEGSHNGLTALHRNRLVDWPVASVAALAACPDGSAIAAGYENGMVEVWDVDSFSCLVVGAAPHQPPRMGRHSCCCSTTPGCAPSSPPSSAPTGPAILVPRPCIHTGVGAATGGGCGQETRTHPAAAAPPRTPQTFPGEEGAQLTGLAWATDPLTRAWRLFASRLGGVVYELDCASRSMSGWSDAYGGAVWALAPEPLACVLPGEAQRLAAACDDGSIRMFSVEAGVAGPQYVRSLAQVRRLAGARWRPAWPSMAPLCPPAPPPLDAACRLGRGPQPDPHPRPCPCPRPAAPARWRAGPWPWPGTPAGSCWSAAAATAASTAGTRCQVGTAGRT